MPRDLSGVLDAVLAGVVVVDAEGRVELLNSAACRILGTSLEVARGRPLDDALGAGHPVSALARSVLETGRGSIENDRRVRRPGAPELVIDASASPLDDGNGGVALILRDRTIQQKLEQRVSERERLAAFGLIAAGIAHEVKNPLGGIRGAAEIVGARTGDAKTRTAAQLIVRETDRIAALVDDLMVFTQGDDVRFDTVNIHRVLDDVLELLAMDPLCERVQVERSFDPSIPELRADPDRLTQVFLNVAKNALQALEPGGGTLTISTRMALDDRLSDAEGSQLPTLLVEVADSGPGIAPEVLEKLATPFFTTRPGGTGLGLAVSRHWIARHGGTLRVDSSPGAGTRVRVALPIGGAP